MFSNKIHIVDKNTLLAIYLFKVAVDKQPSKIVLKNHFLQDWLDKRAVYDDALRPLEQSLENLFPKVTIWSYQARYIELPWKENGLSIEYSKALDLTEISAKLGITEYSITDK